MEHSIIRWHLIDRFKALCDRMGLNNDCLNKNILESILDQYTLGGRTYHGLSHLLDCFTELDKFMAENANAEFDLNALEFAIFYHDYCYDINLVLGKNEEISSQIADGHLSRLGVSDKNIISIRDLILGTYFRSAQYHIHLFDFLKYFSLTYLLMCDLDYTIFGKGEDILNKYDKSVYDEYVSLGSYMEEEYYVGRLKFLHHSLNLHRIYFTDYFYDQYEDKARANIKRLIEQNEEALANIPRKS